MTRIDYGDKFLEWNIMDCLDGMKSMEDNSIDSIVTDPPYFLINSSGAGFMGKEWDSLNSRNTISILCKSKEFAQFVIRFFMSMKVESNMVEESSVHVNVSTKDKRNIAESPSNVPCVENELKENPHTSKVNTNSVQEIVLTKEEVVGLLNELSLLPTEKNQFQNGVSENALFVIPISLLRKELKNIVPESALKLPIENECVDKTIHLTSTDEARINGVIEGMIGKKSDERFMNGMNGSVGCVTNTVKNTKYKHIILENTEKQKIIHWLISLLYVISVTPKLNKTPNCYLKDVQTYDLLYKFHNNWAIEALRVIKPGSFAFIMCAPRSDLLNVTTRAIRDAGFNVAFSPIYWTFASGFPKAMNVSKSIDKRFGAEREVVGKGNRHNSRKFGEGVGDSDYGTFNGGIPNLTASSTPQAKHYDGYYAGFQPKPAVEVIIVAMKPLSEKSYIDQALQSYGDDGVGSGCVNFDDCRIPFQSDSDIGDINRFDGHQDDIRGNNYNNPSDRNITVSKVNQQGRFPANLLCSDDVLNDGNNRVSKGKPIKQKTSRWIAGKRESGNITEIDRINDEGSFSRFFDIDSWWESKLKSLPKPIQKTFPFLITPKSPQNEKYFYCTVCEKAYPMGERDNHKGHAMHCANCGIDFDRERAKTGSERRNQDNVDHGFRPNTYSKSVEDEHNGHVTYSNIFAHPTQKPLMLFSYLITLGSRIGDTILDPFGGTGTLLESCLLNNRNGITFEMDENCDHIINRRINYVKRWF